MSKEKKQEKELNWDNYSPYKEFELISKKEVSSNKKPNFFTRLKMSLHKKNTSIYYSQGFSSSEIEKLPWYMILAIKKWNVLKIFFAAFLLNVIIIAFITRAQALPSGVTGIPTLIMFLVPELQPYFGILFLLVNAPLMIYFHKKVKLSFTLLNWTYLLFSVLWSSVLNITPVLNFLLNITDFANDWSINVVTASYTNSWPILIYGILGGILMGISYAILWKAGASTAGTELVSYYISVKYKKSVGSIMRVFSLSTVVLYFIIYASVRWNLTNNAPEPVYLRDFFVLQIITTFAIVFISTFVLNILYPKYKKINVEISTDNPNLIEIFFNKINYWHPYRIETYKSGRNHQKNYQITTVMYYFEANFLVPDIQNFSPEVWIKMVDVKRTLGKFNSNFVD
ncbi:hypothetical protein CJJ23_02945 [Mycoplasmopsis agassizii]|uniref:YitT family protein n=1 Tax=Mycoplasmopsis agassizii TaxID=33922 RepID=A0A269TJB8_9BACT|nr:YitT family protein [Mycoplasmopsis agassizii]PAK21280.1 hypothetical protein CJJ23_02945 [Mycoplasmopsis agassizii]